MADSADRSGTFVERMRETPLLPPGTEVALLLDTLTTAAASGGALAGLAKLLVDEKVARFLAGVLKGVDCPTLQAGGVDDHVHLLFGLSRTRSTSEVVETVKTSSSKWIKTKGAPFVGFHWQAGYGAFSVSQSEAETVVTYIKTRQGTIRR